MGLTKALDRGRETARGRPLILITWLAGVLLVLDLLARLAGVEIPLAAGRSFGGSMSAAQFGGLVWNERGADREMEAESEEEPVEVVVDD